MPSVLLSIDEAAALTQGELAYQRMRRDILLCLMLPGAFVTEHELMSRYGIGKNACRIALTRLAHEQLVVSRPRRGYQIAPVMVKDVEEIFSLRAHLEPWAARLAVGRVDIARLRELEAACRVRHSVGLSDQINRFMEANNAFHLEIARASGNERLYRTLSGLLDQMSRLVALGFTVQGTKPEIKHDHNAMIDAFEEGDGKRAEFIARRHIETFQAMTLEKVYATLSDTGVPLPLLAERFR